MKIRTEDPEEKRYLNEMVTLTEAAALRKVSVETLRSLIKRGKLKAIRIGFRRMGMTRREALGDHRD